MTLADLETMALSQNPSLARACAMVQAAKGEWLQVGLMPNPIGGYSTMEIGEENTAGQQGGMIGQEIVMGRKLKLNRAVAAQQIRRAEQELQIPAMARDERRANPVLRSAHRAAESRTSGTT